MDRPLVTPDVAQNSPAGATAVLTSVRAALDGSGPALALGGEASTTPRTVPAEVAVVVRTSGSTGEPRDLMLDGAALTASAHATHARLGGPGRWVLALPLTHVAGVQVLIRSLLAGHEPTVVAPGRFEPAALAAAVRESAGGGGPVYTALVPTQLHRVLAAAGPAGLPPELHALRDLSAVLVGGAATPRRLLDRARELGLPVVTTYGMTETCGGCVYDGVPLDGVSVRIGTDGAVHLAGPVLARGHLDRPDLDALMFSRDDGQRWLRTRDLGSLERGVLHVHGRADDVLVTGGENVPPSAVEEVLAGLPGVGQVCVVGVPDEEWGQVVVAVVVPDPAGVDDPPDLDVMRAAVARTLGPAAAPRHRLLDDRLPERGPGKVDRAAVARTAAHRLR